MVIAMIPLGTLALTRPSPAPLELRSRPGVAPRRTTMTGVPWGIPVFSLLQPPEIVAQLIRNEVGVRTELPVWGGGVGLSLSSD